MWNRLYLITKLLYGAAGPDIWMKILLNDQLVYTVSFRYPEMRLFMLRPLLFIVLVMLPTVVRLLRLLIKRLRYNFWIMAPWILVCCLKVINLVTRYNLKVPDYGHNFWTGH